MRGRPLRFLGLVTGGWIAVRVAILWPGGEAPFPMPGLPPVVAAVPVKARPVAVARVEADIAVVRSVARSRYRSARPASPQLVAMAASRLSPATAARRAVDPEMVMLAAMTFPGAFRVQVGPAPGFPSPAAPVASGGRRWSGSVWAIARDGRAGSVASPLLGGSQAGARVAVTLDSSGRVAAFARAATALRGGRADLAAGVQWRPSAAPVHAYVEARRDRDSVAPAVGGFGGGAVTLPAGFRLEGYGQAGMIVRDRPIGFGDGQLRAVRPIGRADVGAGVWGAVQPGARRLDIGPSIALPVSVADQPLRVTLDWRQRVAGNARPASGPVLSLGADF